MNKKLSTFCLLLISIQLSFSQTKVPISGDRTLSYLLTQIDQHQDSIALMESLDENALVFLPDAPPIYSSEVIVELFSFLWQKNAANTNPVYVADSIIQLKNTLVEFGTYAYFDKNGLKNELEYSIKGQHSTGNLTITEIAYGNAKKAIPSLPKPTGNYQVGQTTYFDQNANTGMRPIAFQMWYPSNEKGPQVLKFQTKETAEAICEFLGWPRFNNSFTRLMDSHAYSDIPIAPNNKFAVLIYNHGYGGATSVYQTIFEDLASHGYVVVSIGHKDESAFYIKSDGTAHQTCPNNEFYRSRNPEINNPNIGTHQSTILNSDNSNTLETAYKKMVDLSPLHTASVELWSLDTKVVIGILNNWNRTHPLFKGNLDIQHMGIFGHSVGGATAGELASTALFKAGINLDGFQFGNLINKQLKIPFLFVSSSESEQRYLRVAPFAANAKNTVHHAIIKGFSHSSFSDLQLFSENGPLDITLQRDLIRNYFDSILKQQSFHSNSLMKQYSNLSIQKMN